MWGKSKNATHDVVENEKPGECVVQEEGNNIITEPAESVLAGPISALAWFLKGNRQVKPVALKQKKKAASEEEEEMEESNRQPAPHRLTTGYCFTAG